MQTLDDLRNEAIAWAAASALKRFPHEKASIAQAVEWVNNGEVLLADPMDMQATIDGLVVSRDACPCPEFGTAPEGFCVHRLAFAIQRRALERFNVLARSADAAQTKEPEAEDSLHGVPQRFITEISFQGRKQRHLTYDGLLWLADKRREGLVSLSATFVAVSDELATATATAVFRDGTTWQESADATPQNVSSAAVKPHFPRMALTRAKCRALRDALGVGTCSFEEL